MTPYRYKFEVIPTHSSDHPISSISVKLKFASAQCLSDTATLSLLRPRWTTPSETDQSESDALLGPIKLKSLVDITGKSLTIILAHPVLAVSTPPILWLVFEDLFGSNYSQVSVSTEPLTDPTAMRGSWRTKAFRQYVKQPTTDPSKTKVISIQVSLKHCLNVHQLYVHCGCPIS